MRASVGSLDAFADEARMQDLNPRALLEVDQALADRRHQRPHQQQVLGDERQRLEQIQAMQVRQAAQQFPQRLAQSLELQQHTGMPSPGPEAFMAKLMLMMQRRHGRSPFAEMPSGPSP